MTLEFLQISFLVSFHFRFIFLFRSTSISSFFLVSSLHSASSPYSDFDPRNTSVYIVRFVYVFGCLIWSSMFSWKPRKAVYSGSNTCNPLLVLNI